MTFKQRLRSGSPQIGTFIKTPGPEVIEILALAGLDFVCLDAEHSAIGRRELDHSLAIARALGFPALVRLEQAAPDKVLQALDGGAVGIVVPHVASEAIAVDVARWARFGADGRGYAGSTRSAGYTTRGMTEVLEGQDGEVVVIAQIEDPSGLEAVEAIAKVQGIDALFFGAADLTVGLGLASTSHPRTDEASRATVDAAKGANKALGAFCANASGIDGLIQKGFSLIFAGSDQGMLLAGARTIARPQ